MDNQKKITQPIRIGVNGPTGPRPQLRFIMEAEAYDNLSQGMEALEALKELIEQFGSGPIDVTGNGLASLLGCVNDRISGSVKRVTRHREG